MGDNPSKKYVVVIVHADVWGAYNANKLVKAVHDRGATPILIVTRSTPGKDGAPATKLEDLKLPRVLKENTLKEFFERIDGFPPTDQKNTPEYLTFNGLAKRYCGQDKAYFISSGGKKGGDEILGIFRELEKKNIKPEVVLSGDTLALLPPEITDNYDCFGTHPGPLPEIKGMQGTARSLVNAVLFDARGKRLPKSYLSDNHLLPQSGAYIKGSFFNLATRLDEGPVIETALSPVCLGVSLLQARCDLYDMLTDVVVKHLDTLMDASARKTLIKKAKDTAAEKTSETYEITPELEEKQLRQWMSAGVAHIHTMESSASFEPIQNSIIDPIYLKNILRAYYPKNREKVFNVEFGRLFKPGLKQLQQVLDDCAEPVLKQARFNQTISEGKNADLVLEDGMFYSEGLDSPTQFKGTVHVRFVNGDMKITYSPPASDSSQQK